MQLSSNRFTYITGWLALTLCINVAVPICFGQTPNANQSDTASGAVPTDAAGNFRRKARFLQGEMQGADSGDANADMARRARMRKAIMRARESNGAQGNDPAETFNRGFMNPGDGEGAGMGRNARARFMPDGQGAAGNGRRGFGGRGGFPGGKRALDLTPLNLTEEQKGKIQQMRSRTSTRARELRSKLLSGGQELRDMMFDPAASDDMIRAKGRELRKLHEQVEDIKLDDFLSIRSVLTADQRKHLPEVKPGGPRAAMAGARGNAGDMPPPPGEFGPSNE
ncbi:MAG: periplasmic heavy metal sensor [Candidatus Melainabacteria bacterium]|nr:periplasmic heavy metal sensor [Candidatus Melainabacteria bacterium]